jgi:hypothetical protein
MAHAITDKDKALRRYEAAVEVLGLDHDITKIFSERATELGNKIVGGSSNSKGKGKTLGMLGSELPDAKKVVNTGYDNTGYTPRLSKYRPYAILPIGSTNLQTGTCKYFDIFDTWGKGDDTTIELWSSEYPTRAYKLVFTSGPKALAEIGATQDFNHDQTGRPLFTGVLVDWVNIGDANLLVRKYNIKGAPGYVYK